MSIRSNRPISITTATFKASRDIHDNRPLVLNVAAGVTVSLPAATGSGARYHFIVGTASNATVISGTASATFLGNYLVDDTGDSVVGGSHSMTATAGNNTYSPTTAGGGGLAGDWVEFTDYAVNLYRVFGSQSAVADPTNRFSTV